MPAYRRRFFRRYNPYRGRGRRYQRMAYSKRYRRRGFYRKAYRKYSRKRTWWTNESKIAPVRWAKLYYIDNNYSGNLEGANGYQHMYVYKGNDLYDADHTGAGVQPYGYDQVCGLRYGRYCVKSSKIKIYATVETDVECPNIRAILIPWRSATITYTDMSDLSVLKYAKQVRFGKDTKRGNAVTISHYMTTKKIQGADSQQHAETSAPYNASPASVWYWILIFNTSDWEAAVTVRWDTKITFYSKLYDPISINES